MRIAVVTTLYYSAPYLEEFYRRTKICLEQLTNDYEIIFVNDGSPDDSLEIGVALHRNDERVRVIDLSRNFGHHKAIMTGLAHADADYVFLIDVDLEEEPENLSLFYDSILRAENVDVIYGVQKRRKGKLFEQLTGRIYYTVFNFMTGASADANVLTARLMSRNYVKALVEHQEQEFDIMGLWNLTGFNQKPIVVNKFDKGSSVYSLNRKISLFVNTITAFSHRPLFAILFFGLAVFILSSIAGLYYGWRHVFVNEIQVSTLLLISVWMIAGLIITCLGVIGLYVSKIQLETKKRPYTIIRALYEHKRD
jgi:putative glycosyltransferase